MKLSSQHFLKGLRLACFAAPVLLLFLLFLPEQSLRSRFLVMGSLATIAMGWPVLVWRRRWLRNALLAGEVACAVLFLLPARPHGREAALRESYVQMLESFTGVPYRWGGETEFGVDCSGLVRRAMIRACLWQGVRRLDGGLLRAGASLWLHDCSAEALGDGYRSLTTPVVLARSLNSQDAAPVRAGDLAVVGGGIHVLVSLGGGRWIEADPETNQVIIESVPSKNLWFNSSARIVRWTLLKQAP